MNKTRDEVVAIMLNAQKVHTDYLWVMRKEMERAYNALIAAGVIPQWRPIESAPKGFAILIHYKNACNKSRIIKARYIEQYTEDSGDSDHCEYCEERDTYYTPEGWYEMIDNWPDYTHVQISESPDAWQPLPTPPHNPAGGES